MKKTLALMFCTIAIATLSFAADFTGTWKLNAAKSKAEGMPAPKEQTVTYTPKGAGYEYMAKGVTSTGTPIQASFVYVKDGEKIQTTGFPFWDAIVIKGGTMSRSNVELHRGGKVVGSAYRTLSGDGKIMTISGKFTMPDGKAATYNYVYERQ